MQKISLPPGFDLQTAHPVASRYNDYAIPIDFCDVCLRILTCVLYGLLYCYLNAYFYSTNVSNIIYFISIYFYLQLEFLWYMGVSMHGTPIHNIAHIGNEVDVDEPVKSLLRVVFAYSVLPSSLLKVICLWQLCRTKASLSILWRNARNSFRKK